MEVVMQMMYSYSLELLAAAVGLMLLLELVTLRKINKWKKKEKEQFSELEEKLSRISEKPVSYTHLTLPTTERV